MKIITATFQNAYNYGARLQAYALQKTLIKNGYENLLLNLPFFYSGSKSKGLKAFLRDTYLHFQQKLHYKTYRRFKNNFHQFEKDHLISTQPYSSVEDVMSNPPAADMYLTGSDQVFSFSTSLFPLFFLDFGSKDIPRASYAASLGSYQMDAEQLSYINEKLSAFAKVSLREKQGSDYIKDTCQIDCQTHIDPVFLLTREEWEALLPEKSRAPEKYILCFPMINNKNLQPALDFLKKETGLPVVSIQNKFHKTVKADKYLYDVSVPEFISLIKNAEAVVTTSFHASAMSIIFHTPIYSLTGSYKPERIKNISELLHLEDRVIYDTCSCFPPIETDYSNIDSILATEREKAFSYIESFKSLS